MRLTCRCLGQRVATYLVPVLLSATTLSGCASAWLTLTPSPPADGTASTGMPAAPRSAGPATARPRAETPSPQPTHTPGLTSLDVTRAPIQSWADPNDVTALLCDGEFLWAATGGGVVRWDRPTGEYRLFAVADGLASLAARGIAQDGDGHIWVGYADELSWSEYDGETWRTYESRETAVESRYQAMLKARHSDPRLWSSRADSTWLWLPTGDGRAKAYDGARWRSYGADEGVTRGTWLVATSRTERVWAVGEGVSTALEGERWWEDHTPFSGVPEGSRIVDLAVDGEGSLWLAFVGPPRLSGGVARLDPASNRWVGYRHALNPAIPRQVHGVELDAQGGVWLCGEGGMAHRPPKGRWQALPLETLTVQSFARDGEGRFWLGTDWGIWSVRIGDRHPAEGNDLSGPWLVPSPILGNDVTHLALDREGTLWIGTSKGVSYVRPDGKTGILTREEPLCLAVGPAGRVWVAFRSGLYTVQSNASMRLALDERAALVAFNASGAAWVCTEDGQLGVLDGSGWRNVADVAALTGASPRAMVVGAEGTVWLGTETGLGILYPDGEFALATVEDGLPHLDIRSLALGPDGAVWIATARGLARRMPSGRWTRFTTRSTEGGLRSMEMHKVHMDEQGTLWMTTSAGISVRTEEADWSYLDLPGARAVCPSPSGAIWVGTRGGLYRVRRDILTLIP